MTDAFTNLREVLEADAHRRADAARHAPPHEPETGEHTASWELRFRLVNTFPRETRPLFASLRASLAPYGYTLSPLHPGHNLHRPIMQTELTRLGVEDAPRFAPLVFELEPATATARVYVRQFGGRAAPDFGERQVGLADSADLAAVQAILSDYVACMLAAPRAAVA